MKMIEQNMPELWYHYKSNVHKVEIPGGGERRREGEVKGEGEGGKAEGREE